MMTFRLSADVQNDHRIVLTCPPRCRTGKRNSSSVSSEAGKPDRRPRTSLVDWAEENSEHWGNRLDASDVGALRAGGSDRAARLVFHS